MDQKDPIEVAIPASLTAPASNNTSDPNAEVTVVAFNREEVLAVVKECVDCTIQNQPYHHNKVAQWNANVVELTLKKLSNLNKPFKYIVTCVIMQKNGAGLHAASSCYWDTSTDGSATYRYENKTMHVMVNVYGLAI